MSIGIIRKLKTFIYAIGISILFTFISIVPSYAGENLEVHFIDVGQGDAALIKLGDNAMLIDGGEASQSQKIYSYLKDNGIGKLDYIIATHDDADHVGGLSAAVQYAGSNIGTVMAPSAESSKERFNTFKRKLSENGKTITVPKAGDTYRLGDAKFQVLSAGGSGNESSIVLRLEYGDTSFLFTGDATEDIEKQIINSDYKVESDVLKVGHHGSDTSTCYRFLREVNPEISVISVGRDNSYGHPTDNVLSRLRDADSKVYRTDNNGDVVITSDGSRITVKTQKECSQENNLIAGGKGNMITGKAAEAETNGAKDSKAQQYVLNTNTHKFHYPSCSSVGDMKAKNRKDVTDTRENIISQGYVPCKRCNP